jgi:CD109 antigen
LEDNYSSGRSLYELGIIAYALKVADSSKASSAYSMFSNQKTETTTLLFWSTSGNRQTSLDIEITSYGLLTSILRSDSSSTILKIVKYLVSQANNLGGYRSSQDTVMAFYALSQFARTYSLDANVELTMTPNVGDEFSATVDSSNAFTLQSFDLNASTRKMKVAATTQDSGLAIVSLVCNFYEDPTKVIPVFNVTYNFGFTCASRITMSACASYIPDGKSNMAIMIVTLPSGFIFNARQYQNNPEISRTEITNQGTKATFYFNSISNEISCATVNAYRDKFVAELKPATIEVYDYYDTCKSHKFYS